MADTKTQAKTNVKPDEGVKLDPKMAKVIAKAKLAQKARRAAPMVSANAAKTIPQKETIRILRESGAIPKGYHAMFGNAKHFNSYIAQGYEPVLSDGEMVRSTFGSSDPLMMIPEDIYQDTKKSVAAADAKQLEASMKALKKGNAVSQGNTVEEQKLDVTVKVEE